ncbi:50S ribosomal protein L31e [Candidatus Micrarchaeota archaeon]|nr:50S ribosomal protein L31e [Candidatus Micrarchaeota archaeon]
MAELERIYTIPLRGAYEGVRTKRSRKAVKIVRAFISRHMKAGLEAVSISEEVNKAIWKRGIQKPPRKIKVRAVKGADVVNVLLVDEKAGDAKARKAPKKKEAAAQKKEEPKEKAPEAPVKKEEAPKEGEKESAAPKEEAEGKDSKKE